PTARPRNRRFSCAICAETGWIASIFLASSRSAAKLSFPPSQKSQTLAMFGLVGSKGSIVLLTPGKHDIELYWCLAPPGPILVREVSPDPHRQRFRLLRRPPGSVPRAA